MIANIALDDALILPHRANPTGLNFRERQVKPLLLKQLSAQCLQILHDVLDFGGREPKQGHGWMDSLSQGPL